MEEIRGITWDLWGEELSHEQTIQRIVNAGFPVKDGVALTMFAIVEGESGEYQRAWHINCERDADGDIVRTEGNDGKTYFDPKSIDLGFMQFNVPAPVIWQRVEMTSEAVERFVEFMFDANPALANPVEAAKKAYTLWKARGFQPWYAYQPGTDRFWEKKRYGAMAFARWHLHAFVGKRDRITDLPLDFKWKE